MSGRPTSEGDVSTENIETNAPLLRMISVFFATISPRNARADVLRFVVFSARMKFVPRLFFFYLFCYPRFSLLRRNPQLHSKLRQRA